MGKFEDAMKLMDTRYKKNELWPLATTDGKRQYVSFVCGYFEDGCVYVVTTTTTRKMQHIALHPEVAVCSFGFDGHGVGENLGWVRDERNTAMMEKLRVAFAEWYNNGDTDETKPETCLLRICLTDGILHDDEKTYGERRYELDFANRTAR